MTASNKKIFLLVKNSEFSSYLSLKEGVKRIFVVRGAGGV